MMLTCWKRSREWRLALKGSGLDVVIHLKIDKSLSCSLADAGREIALKLGVCGIPFVALRYRESLGWI